MPSPACERAIEEATRFGNAILKFISPNEIGITGSHQRGFYMPKAVWEMYTPHAPEKDKLGKHRVSIVWQDGQETHSVVTWYGQKTRSEYRLTRFGRDFPWLAADTVGNLLVLIPRTLTEFSAYVFDLDEDIEEVQAALGIEPFANWGVYRNGVPQIEDEGECIERRFRNFADSMNNFPSGDTFSANTWAILQECVGTFSAMSPDEILMRCMEAEYKLFRLVERKICQPDIARVFRDVDDFLQTASRILNRRKARAGRSLENHVHEILSRAAVPHEMRPDIDGKPDVIIPSRHAYYDSDYPADKLFVVGIKTTCKDRWRQVLNEGKRKRDKHIITAQPGISGNQLAEMHDAKVTLVVPLKLHREYPQEHNITLLSIEQFIDYVRSRL